jgi:uncharacterized protein
MLNELFEWDDEKARANLVKHRIDFHDAVLVFDDPGVCDDPDESMNYDEERFKAVGMIEGVVTTVAITRKAHSPYLGAQTHPSGASELCQTKPSSLIPSQLARPIGPPSTQ